MTRATVNSESVLDAALPAVCDVAIVGAGPAGTALARRLALSGCRVVLLERSSFDTPRVGESLAPSVQPLLTDLGVWAQFVELQPLPSFGTRSAWGASTAEQHSHLLTPYLNGWHVDRLAFDRMMAQSAVRAGARLQIETRVVRCTQAANGGFVLHIAHGAEWSRVSELQADFVVDASGRRTATARWFGARHAVFDRLVGVAAQFNDTSAESHCYTLVETTPDGWWYSAPVTRAHSMVMLMTDGDLARQQGTAAMPQWRIALQHGAHTDTRIGGATLRWGPRIFSAVSHRLIRDPADSTHWLAVGDAALAVDPISGSGVVRALRTALAAASTVLKTLSGDRIAQANYEAARDEECTAYLVERAAYYDIEQRWPEAPFWQRRALRFGQLHERR